MAILAEWSPGVKPRSLITLNLGYFMKSSPGALIFFATPQVVAKYFLLLRFRALEKTCISYERAIYYFRGSNTDWLKTED